MCLGTFARRAQSLATFFIFVRVRISGTQCLFFIGSSFGISHKKRESNAIFRYFLFCAFYIL